MIRHQTVAGEPVRLIALPRSNHKAQSAWHRFIESDDVFGLDVETTAIEELGAYSPTIKTRLVQFGNHHEAWVLDPADPAWHFRAAALLNDPRKRFVSHNEAFDATRIWYEFGIDLGDRSIDTLPMAALIHPGRTLPGGKRLKNLCDHYVDTGLSEAEQRLNAMFVDEFYASKPRKTPLLPKSFKAGVSLCRKPRGSDEDKCAEPSSPLSRCGYCEKHYLARAATNAVRTWGWNNVALDNPVFLEYAGLDAVYVRRLLDVLAAKIKAAKMTTLSRTEQRVKRLMVATSRRGHRVDPDWTLNVLRETEADFEAAETDVLERTGLKPRSSKMRGWLTDHGCTVRSLDKDHLPGLLEAHADNPEVRAVLDGLMTVSTMSNLLTNLRTVWHHAAEGDGYCHPDINTQQAHTGRMSITAPAMQTLAKTGEKGRKLRGCFIAREGHVLVGADYDSQEIRLAAAFSKDAALLRIINEGLSQHVLTAESIFPDFKGKADDPVRYHQAKTLDFAQQYGAMPRKIAATLGITESEATALWQKWRDTYSGLVRWSDAQADLRLVRNPFGRVIPRDPIRSYANGNYMIQSTGRDVLGRALIRLADAGWGDTIWLPIHDEIVLEVPEDRVEEARLALGECMTMTVCGVEIPAEGEVIGHRWRGLT